MPTLQPLDKPVILVKANPTRSLLVIGNLTDSTVYVATSGKDIDTFTSRAWPVGLDGNITVCQGIDGYKGPIFCMATVASDIRVIEG